MQPERIKVWQCIGCGRIDDPKPCIGVCKDQKVEYVLAVDHDREVNALRDAVQTHVPHGAPASRLLTLPSVFVCCSTSHRIVRLEQRRLPA